MEEQNNNPNQVTPDTTPDAAPVTTPDTAPVPQTEDTIETPHAPKPPDKIKRAWSFISTNSTVLDLFVNTLTFFIVACFGTWLILNQNGLMENQNKLIQQQMFLDEASRRSALITLMSNIMDKVDDEIKEQRSEFLKKGISKSATDTLKYSLSKSLIGQIAALSHSFKPYRYMEGDNLIEKPLSPERGQLLITLTLLPLDTATLKKIYQSATFESADLQNTRLSAANLSGAILNNANLNWAILNDANLNRANLSGANLNGVYLSGANLIKANLIDANLTEAYLTEAKLNGAILWGAKLNDANLNRAILWSAKLNGTKLNGVSLKGTYLTINQLSESKSLYQCENLHDSLKLPLQQSHLQLFQKPDQKNY